MECEIAGRRQDTRTQATSGNQSVEGNPSCGQIVYEADYESRDKIRSIRFNASQEYEHRRWMERGNSKRKPN